MVSRAVVTLDDDLAEVVDFVRRRPSPADEAQALLRNRFVQRFQYLDCQAARRCPQCLPQDDLRLVQRLRPQIRLQRRRRGLPRKRFRAVGLRGFLALSPIAVRCLGRTFPWGCAVHPRDGCQQLLRFVPAALQSLQAGRVGLDRVVHALETCTLLCEKWQRRPDFLEHQGASGSSGTRKRVASCDRRLG